MTDELLDIFVNVYESGRFSELDPKKVFKYMKDNYSSDVSMSSEKTWMELIKIALKQKQLGGKFFDKMVDDGKFNSREILFVSKKIKEFARETCPAAAPVKKRRAKEIDRYFKQTNRSRRLR